MKTRWTISIALVLLVAGGAGAWHAFGPRPTDAEARLVADRCALCHLVPPPDALPSSGWEAFLARKRSVVLGFIEMRDLPESWALSPEELEAVRAYYLAQSQDQDALLGPPLEPTRDVPWLERFRAEAATGLADPEGYVDVSVDGAADEVWLSDITANRLVVTTLDGTEIAAVPLPGPPGRLEVGPEEVVVAVMGGRGGGGVQIVPRDPSLWPGGVRALPRLRRPIRAYPASVGGVPALVVDEFGIAEGGVRSWPLDDLEAEPAVLVDDWGVVGSDLFDLDEDGDRELVALVSQERERLVVREGTGATLGEPVTVFQAHPSFGFNGLRVADLTGDGRPELITLNGDNYDIANGPMKPYHGARIFENRGGLRFADPVFLPLQGVTDVALGDMDSDGDLDVVLVSGFPDTRLRPYQSAVLYEQVAPLRFEPRSIGAARGGRWVAVEARDWDGDGDLDLALAGTFSANTPADERWSRNAGPDPSRLLLLENTGRARAP